MRHPALGSFVFFVAAPGATAGLVPWLVTGWEGSPAGWDAVDLLGGLVGLAGLAMVVACFVRGPAAPASAHRLDPTLDEGNPCREGLTGSAHQ